MEVRKMEIDFSDAKIHWNRDEPEWTQIWNAFSIAAPAFETFLNKVVRQMKERLPESETELRRDADLFIGQEAQHTKMHRRFNEILRKEYPAIFSRQEEKIKAEYSKFFDDKGLKFCIAYCDGFETFGPILAGFFWGDALDLMKDMDEAGCFLWMWHTAEEFEHRTVCNYIYEKLYGGYIYRIFHLWYTLIHLGKFVLPASYQLIQHDRKTGAIKGRLRSDLRYAKVLMRLLSYVGRHMVTKGMRPGYDPGPLPAPGSLVPFLEEQSRRFGVLERA